MSGTWLSTNQPRNRINLNELWVELKITDSWATTPEAAIDWATHNHKSILNQIPLGEKKKILTMKKDSMFNQFGRIRNKLDHIDGRHSTSRNSSTRRASNNSICLLPTALNYWGNRWNWPVIPRGMLSQTLAALCDINQTRSYGNTCNQHKHPSLLCTSGEDLSACRPNII